MCMQWFFILPMREPGYEAKLKEAKVCPCYIEHGHGNGIIITSTFNFNSTWRQLTPVFACSAYYKCQGPTNLCTKQPAYIISLKHTIDYYGEDVAIFITQEVSVMWNGKTIALWSAAAWWKNCSYTVFVAKVISDSWSLSQYGQTLVSVHRLVMYECTYTYYLDTSSTSAQLQW